MEPPSSSPFSERILEFLRVPRLATLSTIDPDGAPHQAVIWYAIVDDGLLINSRMGRRWPSNLERDPRISLAVAETVRFHWVGVKGRAELVRRGEDAVADIMDMARRYGGDPEVYRGQDRVTFRVVPERVFEYAD
jgi:PPOX class probable F420-dependent enzyme